MTELEEKILKELKLGHRHAIPGELLARRLSHNYRIVRSAILSLIKQRHLILSSTKPPKGYFIAETQEEVKEYLKTLRSRLIGDAVRYKNIRLAGRRLLQPEQLKLQV